MPESQATVQPGRHERHQSVSESQATVQPGRHERHQSVSKSQVTVQPDRPERHDRRADTNDNLLQRRGHNGDEPTIEDGKSCLCVQQ
jgi:hypothetical protein